MYTKAIFLWYIFLIIAVNNLYAQEETLQRKKIRVLHFLAGKWDVEADSRLSLNGKQMVVPILQRYEGSFNLV